MNYVAVKIATIHNIKPIRGSTVVFCNASAEMNSICNTAKNLGALSKLNEVGVLLGFAYLHKRSNVVD